MIAAHRAIYDLSSRLGLKIYNSICVELFAPVAAEQV
jgi:hypothetical protein